MKYAYYPGCAGKATVKEANRATRAVAEHLGIKLIEFPNFSCCGAGILHEERPNLSTAINARNFAIAEKEGLDIVTICNTCQLTMLKAKKELDSNKNLKERVNRRIAEFGLEYTGKIRVRHLIWALIEDYGLEDLAGKVEKDLGKVRVAPFYGCHLLRPKELIGKEDPNQPNSLEQMINALGAKPIDYEAETNCCGFHIMLVNQEHSVAMVEDSMLSAKSSGADVVVTPCTLCQLTLDSYQHLAEKKSDKKINMPVIHLPQFIGLTMGLGKKELGLKRHLVALPKGLGLD